MAALPRGAVGVSVASISTPEPITSRISIGTHKSCALKMDLCTGFHQFAPAADPAVFAEKLEEKNAGEEVQEQAEADPRTMARDQAGRCGGSSLPALLSAQQSLAVLEEVAGRPPRATAVISLPAFSPPWVAVASACHPVLHFPEVEAVECPWHLVLERPEVQAVAAGVHHHPQQMQSTSTMMKTSRTKMSVDLMER